MARDFKEEIYGDNVALLDCPVCEWSGEVYYATKPPTYCSNACKQKAARQRKKKREEAMAWRTILDGRMGLDKATPAEIRGMAFHIRSLAEREEKTRDNSFTPADNRQQHNIVAWLFYDLFSYLYDLAEREEKTAVSGDGNGRFQGV